jgi:hypothetical protein
MVLMPGGVMGLAHRIRVRFVTVQEPSGTRAGEVDATSFESRPADLAGHRVTTSTSGEDRP